MKHLFLTGGSSGIGAAIARKASSDGWHSWITYRSGKARADSLVSEIQAHGGTATAVELVLEEPSSIDLALAQVEKAHARIEALVLNAAPPPALASFSKTTRQELQEQFQSNVVGNHYLLTQTWKRFFLKQGGGHVVGVSSQAASTPPWSHMSSYVIGKRGLQALLECALSELGAHGLRASLIVPGYTDTPMLRGLHPYILEAAQEKASDKKFLSAEHVAAQTLDCLETPPESQTLGLRLV